MPQTTEDKYFNRLYETQGITYIPIQYVTYKTMDRVI